MSIQTLSARYRAQSTASLRSRNLRNNSEDKAGADLKRSSTVISFRPKLQRLIQNGKVEQILHLAPDSKAHLHYTNHVSEMQKELASTKRSLSTFVTKSCLKQKVINTAKNEIRKVERQIEIIRQQAILATKRLSFRNEELAERRIDQETAYWNQKMVANMESRSYKDEVCLKSKHAKLQKDYDAEQQTNTLLKDKYYTLKQLNNQLQSMKHEGSVLAQKQADQANYFIQLLNADMSERELLGQLKVEKHKKQGEINAIASSNIEHEQLERILEVLYAHRILSQIIRTKSNNLLSRYQHVNRAYSHMKSNSNITDPDKILRRMQDHDKLYEDALNRVNALEADLHRLQNSLHDCMKSKNQILSKEGKTEMLVHGYYQGMEKDKYDLLVSERQKQQDRSISNEVLKNNIISWGKNMFKHFGISLSENNTFVDCLTDLVVRIRHEN